MQFSFHGFMNKYSLDELKEYEDSWLLALPTIFAERTNEYAKSFYQGLFPISDNIKPLLSKLQEFVKGVDKE